ncbi:MAG TPA: hypothetical protein ENN47_00490 [Mesotoga infera]|uniref:Uncharacterized protein n=1 Tax=Mesotoga infera TaxID=1236046 RepID=A0A7C1CUT2_9BACT|nr:hypothetical protein [Mesotoga infera]
MKRDNSSLIELASETADLLFKANRGELSKPAKTLMEISKKFGFDEARKLDLNQYRKIRTDGSGDNLHTIINKVKELCRIQKLSNNDIPRFLGYLSRELKYFESAKANTQSGAPEKGEERKPTGNKKGHGPNRPVNGPATYSPFADLRKKLDN